MDIQQWLATTADGAAPEQSSDDLCIPEGFRAHPQRPADREARPAHSYRRRRRQRASSDSSIIAPEPTNRGRWRAAARSLPSERVRSAGSADQESRGSDYSSSRSPSPALVPEKAYERRPRHKTRPDRYEPKHGKRKARHDARRERHARKKQRKSHRSGDGGRTAGLVESFQLKNGPKNSRLTMKPSATAGLFKHGRASAQVTGRGGGLPDLVFNEMRFLQRPQEHQDAPADAPEQQKGNKRDRKRPSQQDISAYFNAKKLAREQQVERDDTQPNNSRDGPREPEERRQITPPVELPSRPFLGFGSKGNIPGADEVRSEHTTYFSWSQTPSRDGDAAQSRRIVAPTVDAGELCSNRPRKASKSGRRHMLMGKDQQRPDLSIRRQRRSQKGQLVPSARTKSGPLIEVHQSSTNSEHQGSPARKCPTKTTTSQSLPRHPDGRAHNELPLSVDQETETYRTSDIVKIREDAVMPARPRRAGQTQSSPFSVEKENQHPDSSFSLDRLLNDARGFARTAESGAAAQFDHLAHQEFDRAQNHQDGLTVALPVRGESNQTLQEYSQPTASREGQGQHSKNRHLPSNIPRADQRLRELQYSTLPQDHRMIDHDGRILLPQEDEILDNGQEPFVQVPLRQPVYASIQQAEELARGLTARDMHAIHDPSSEQFPSEFTGHWQQDETTPSISLLGHSTSTGRSLEPEQAVGTASDQGLEGMGGFWKPNKLY